MRDKAYSIVSGIVFAVVAVVHLIRIINHTDVQFGSHMIPMAGSWAGMIAAGLLSLWGLSRAFCCGSACETPPRP